MQTNSPTEQKKRLLKLIRVWLAILIFGLVLSGVTAFPLTLELPIAAHLYEASPLVDLLPGVGYWLNHVADGLATTNRQFPFIFYGTDWLAFAHLLIAIAFIGPLLNPVKNIWVIQWGMLACVGIIPLALIAGAARGIPFGWELLDMSFGVVGIIPLLFAYRYTKSLEHII
jgi:hypothetical protein